MTAHTPGPWSVQRKGKDEINQGFTVADVSDTWKVIAGDTGDGEADARLIARAPSLLAENARLREALEAVDSLMHDDPDGNVGLYSGWIPVDGPGSNIGQIVRAALGKGAV